MHGLDYSDLQPPEVQAIERALLRGDGERITWCIPEKKFAFMLRNYKQLATLGILEANWMTAYLHEPHFNNVPLALLKEIFDACDKRLLQQHHPIPDLPRLSGDRFSLFRGCAGADHRMGMSWLTSLDKAIWYAAHHAAFHRLDNLAVYAAVVDRAEIYCCCDHYDLDYIVCPKEWWRVDVPISEFRLDRPR